MTRARQRHCPRRCSSSRDHRGHASRYRLCARGGGWMLAVATGYSVTDLETAGADVALPDLKDTARVLELLR